MPYIFPCPNKMPQINHYAEAVLMQSTPTIPPPQLEIPFIVIPVIRSPCITDRLTHPILCLFQDRALLS